MLKIGDITKLEVDAIVNSAHPTFLAGSCVCGAIHRVAEKELEEECRRIIPADLPQDKYLLRMDSISPQNTFYM